MSSANPTLALTINSVNDTEGCQSQQYKFLSSSSTNINNSPKKIDLSSTWSKKGIAFVDLTTTISWNAESQTKIEDLKK
mgnify:FL=1